MIESLTDQWMRAGSLLVQTPGYLRALMVTRVFVLNEALGRPRTDPRTRADHDAHLIELAAVELARTELRIFDRIAKKDDRPLSTDHEDPALVRALRAETGVRLRWAVTVGATYRAPTTDDVDELSVHREGAIGSWAASAIVRRNLTVPALEAEPTLVQLAEWLERFSSALALALTRMEMVRVPDAIVGGAMDLRADLGARAERSPVDRTGSTFSSVDLEHWRLTPPKGHQLALHVGFESGAAPKASDVRAVLSGGFLRAYLATWALTEDGNNPHGLFEMDARRILLELYGLTPKPTTTRGKRYSRPPPSSEQELARHLEALQSTLLEGIGDVRVGPRPQPLVSHYRDANDTRRVYQHAPLALIAVSNRFVQVPRAVLRLDSKDTPLALGVTRVLRQHAREVLRGTGFYRAPLQQLARAAGEDVSQQTRDRGAALYYRALAERMGRVVREGQLGDLHLEGEGPSAVATLTPSGALATVYQSLAANRPEQSLEAAIAERMGAPRKTGRPRKHVR